MYRAGDYVYPVNLPRRTLCRIAEAESGRSSASAFQILTLEPLEGPWRDWQDTRHLVRFDDEVRPAGARDLWRASAPRG
jgi:hypothetical protein